MYLLKFLDLKLKKKIYFSKSLGLTNLKIRNKTLDKISNKDNENNSNNNINQINKEDV